MFDGRAACVFACRVFASSCAQKMAEQPKMLPYEESKFFNDHSSARPVVPDTVARGNEPNAVLPAAYKTANGGYVDALPFPLTEEVLQRGREHYEIFCSMCHGYTGEGDGMIPRRGFSVPPSLHRDDVRAKPIGFYFDVITNGYGARGRYSYQIAERDRWAITAYIRALQLSRRATVNDVPTDARDKLR